VPNVELINEISILDSASLWVSVVKNDFIRAVNYRRSGCSWRGERMVYTPDPVEQLNGGQSGEVSDKDWELI
jgi:hypothetical protein